MQYLVTWRGGGRQPPTKWNPPTRSPLQAWRAAEGGGGGDKGTSPWAVQLGLHLKAAQSLHREMMPSACVLRKTKCITRVKNVLSGAAPIRQHRVLN